MSCFVVRLSYRAQRVKQGRRGDRRGTRVEFNVDDLPRAELGGIYTTYVLWAISPDGHVDNLSEIKRSGSSFIDSKPASPPAQTFA